MWLQVACGAGVAAGVAGILLYTQRRRLPEVKPPALDGGRPLGYVEWMLLECCDIGAGHTSRVFIVSSKHPITKELLRQSLKRLVAIHPPLRIKVVWHMGKPWMVPTKDVPIDLNEVQTSDWKTVVEEEMLIKFNSSAGQFWRMKLLPNVSYTKTSATHPHQAALVLSFSHVISDGTGQIMMFNDLLTILNDVMEGRESTIPAAEGLPPSLEECLGLKPDTGIFSAIKVSVLSWIVHFQCVRVFLLSLVRNKFLDDFGAKFVKTDTCEVNTRLIAEEFPEHFASKLLMTCRENKCTVTYAVQTAASYAVAAFWPLHGRKDTEVELRSLMPFGLRNREIKGSLASYKLANYAAAVEFDHKVRTQMESKESFWQTARKAQAQVREAMEKKLHTQWAKTLMDMNRIGYKVSTLLEDVWKRPAPKRHGVLNNVLILNNLGNCSYLDRQSESSIRLLACHQSVAAHNSGPVFTNYIITFEGKLFLTVNYYPYITPEKVAKQYVAALKENLQKALGS